MAASRDRVCELCHGHHLQLSAPTQWRNEEARKYVTSMQVQSDVLENARHCGASLTEYTRRTWSSYMHLTVIRMWLNLLAQATESHVYTGTVNQAWL